MLKALLVMAFAILGLGYGAAALLTPSVTKNFKVEVTLTIEGEVLTRSAVWQVTVQKQFNPLPGGLPMNWQVRGEAIPFPTKRPGETVFVLRRPADDLSSVHFGGLILQCLPSLAVDRILAELPAFKGGCEVADHDLEVADVVVAVDGRPSVSIGSAGPIATGQVKFLSVTATATDEAVSVGLANKYPWIADLALPDLLGPGTRVQDGSGIIHRDRIYRQDFSTESR